MTLQNIQRALGVDAATALRVQAALDAATPAREGEEQKRERVVDTETGLVYEVIGRRDIKGETWVDLAHPGNSNKPPFNARSVSTTLFGRIFKPEAAAPSSSREGREALLIELCTVAMHPAVQDHLPFGALQRVKACLASAPASAPAAQREPEK